jgi:hypothetical protein
MNKTYYQEKLEKLPENLQYAVMMSNWQQSLVQIQSQFKLHIDQTQVLEDSTIKLMFGDIDAPDFINHMFNDAHINSELAADILLAVDLKILKNIRQRLEAIEEADRKDEELENLLLDDEEKEARETADEYAKYYAEVDKIHKETEEEMLKEGILPDGSNITDEMLGITTEIPSDIKKEKDDLLNEINTPTKSFTLTNQYVSKPIVAVEESVIEIEAIPVDHQLQNTHVEEPFHEEDIIPEHITPIVEEASIKQPLTTLANTPSEIKKPITIKLDDIYREPIE